MRKKIFILSFAVILAASISFGVYGAFRVTSIIVGNTSSAKIGSADIELKYVSDRTNETYNDITASTPGYSSGVLVCYASELRASDNRGYVELCDLAVDVSVSSNIDTRLRVKIQNSWNSYKVYNSGTPQNNGIEKVNNAFTFASSDWYYDLENNYAYYNGILEAGSNVKESLLTFSDYHYPVISNSSYKETIFVVLEFQVDLVQANRAEEVWNVDFNEIF